MVSDNHSELIEQLAKNNPNFSDGSGGCLERALRAMEFDVTYQNT